jgi:hypothetical protein
VIPFALDPQRADEGQDEATRVGPAPAIVQTASGVETGQTARRARQGNTALLLERLTTQAGYETPRPGDLDAPYGRFGGKRIIGSGSRVGGGVYLGRKPREAIVVDVGADSLLRQTLDKWFQGLRAQPERLRRGDRAIRRHLEANLPQLLADLVEQALPFDEEVVRSVARELDVQPDQLVPLDAYLARRGGVCRHQVCFVGATLEWLLDEGWLADARRRPWFLRWLGPRALPRPAVTIERKHVPGSFSHAWVRWTRRDGVVFVLDAAQSVYVRLDALDEDGRTFYGPG